jgi:CheY-like chemotaxis protein
MTLPNPTPNAPAAPTVLLVEDDELIRSSTTEMVRDLGYRVVEASSAEEAVGLLGEHDIGVLMANIGLPGMSGDVFAAQARCIRPTLRVVFATGKDHVRGDPADEGGAVLLRKPYDTAAIKVALNKVRARQAG